ncbi:NAD(P)-dependent dehydrogenase (short-subunit alcohol dehydrogenase family) [Salsuginibacillus halophilus]|uniref:NAD(P)-dependent dehydrogenase (Short-subunit alcohol dehydrogenase family) n=1 Tax=Salsuginibacillus halophilus TaxID=517424 RepID=A0A2P8H982_9BACI|nr:SDR family NAD(P)-dependent oxidoreductase [Salsuginibacillus halophilus]PSL42782.1 NAD(P)-dependent dehydrogenase (short-subunit alcohol dehydrogenase family) [Salsuginibacillus halophilus]
MARLDGKTALITGGSAGIGKETAKLFLQEGARVALVDINEDELTKTAEELEDPENVITMQGDVSNEEDVKRYVNQTVETFGQIDILFNNAGIEGKVAPLTEQRIEDFEQVMSVNVRGTFLNLQYVLPIMQQQKSGSVINNSSVAGFIGSPGVAPYVTSKHAVIGLTKTAALETAEANVRVNSIHPSPVETRMMRSLESGANPDAAEDAKKAFTAGIPLGRYGESEEIAKLALFLASDESQFITGAQYRIDGGMAAT